MLKYVAVIMLLSVSGLQAQEMYQVSPNVDLPVRQGPGPSYGLVTMIPAGSRVRVYRCVPPPRNSQADWCELSWRGYSGWAGTSAMYPLYR